jgi:hypothetical protein
VIARLSDRPSENVHVQYLPPRRARGLRRQAGPRVDPPITPQRLFLAYLPASLNAMAWHHGIGGPGTKPT